MSTKPNYGPSQAVCPDQSYVIRSYARGVRFALKEIHPGALQLDIRLSPSPGKGMSGTNNEKTRSQQDDIIEALITVSDGQSLEPNHLTITTKQHQGCRRDGQHRVRVVFQKSSAACRRDPLFFHRLIIDPAAHVVELDGKSVILSPREFDLLHFLARHHGQVFNRSQLLKRVWGYDYFGDECTVTVHIHRPRKKLKTENGRCEVIQTVWGIGYIFQSPGKRNPDSEEILCAQP
jgi:DNA-binding winged helix-turn-helix (wHTH) protein